MRNTTFLVMSYLTALALILLSVKQASAEIGKIGKGLYKYDRDSTNWFEWGWHDEDVRFVPRPYHYHLFRSNNMKRPDKGLGGHTYHSFRNPSMVNSRTGRLLAFGEGRRYDNREFGYIDIVLKRNTDLDEFQSHYITDYAHKWQPMQELFPGLNGTWTNPTAVPDGGTIYLFMNWNRADYSRNGNDTLITGEKTKKIDNTEEGRRRVYLSESVDDGKTWSPPKDMTEIVTPPGSGWDVVGPGRGIKLRYTAEIVVPAMGRNIIGRGKAGKRTWSYQLLNGSGEEGTIVQTPDDRLFRNDRANPGDGYRRVSRGTLDEGFEPFYLDKNLPDPGDINSGGHMIMYSYRNWSNPFPENHRIIFINPASNSSNDALRAQISYYYDASSFGVWHDFKDSPPRCKMGGFDTGRATSAFIPGATKDFLGILSELAFNQTGGGSRVDHFTLYYRFTVLAWILDGHTLGVMTDVEEEDPEKRIDPDGMRRYPNPEDDPRPIQYPNPKRGLQRDWSGKKLREYGG
ncbi:hypothetical protein QQS21_000768 [Conoideocrella luteorostrata]|uniref:Sialidase domain-containing protein n=1 Tax=Conoideocrella luteorostrata TaxID=1105319 RepID=A0AAJ0D1G0_9HYPO|nr:hypothetical protein QQS21_000768 [Conoideocrella luteorostrata]